MRGGKGAYLKRLTSKMKFSSTQPGGQMSGSTPPSVFVGRYGYPRVSVGPLIPEQHGDTRIMDSPEQWMPSKRVGDIIGYRLNLVRGKYSVRVDDRSRTIDEMQEIALARRSFNVHADFSKKPRGSSFSEWRQPFGPSAPLRSLEMNTNNIKMDKRLEKAYYDTDLLSREAVVALAEKLPTSAIQKAFSVGAFGLEKSRRLVPTRWSITAVDSTLADHLLDKVRFNPVIDGYRLYEYRNMNSYFAVLLTPTTWKYEMIEAFIHVLGREEVVFSDYEIWEKKKYSGIGGCYYSGKMAILEQLAREGRQAGAIVFRESTPGYVPLGVWLVREAMRNAMSKEPKRFSSLNSALKHVSEKLSLPFWRYRKASALLKQRTLSDFACR